MGNPFEWSTRKRQNANDPYEHYFRDDVDFPHFGSTWDAFNRMGNKRSQHPSEVNDRSGFFDYLPTEFRQYMPENFGQFDSRRNPGQNQGQHSGPHQHVPQQHHEPSNTQQSNSKTNLCDASIQTDDLTSNQHAENNGNAAPNENQPSANQPNNEYSKNSFFDFIIVHHGQHRMIWMMDVHMIYCRTSWMSMFNLCYIFFADRGSASSSSTSTPYGNQVHMSTSADGPSAHAGASAGNDPNLYYQQSPHYEEPYGRQYQQHPYVQHYSPQPHPNQNAPQQQSTQTTQGVRNVPIFIEGSNVPVNRSNENVPQAYAKATSAAVNKPRPEPLNKDSFELNDPIPAPASQEEHQHSGMIQTIITVPLTDLVAATTFFYF